MITVFYLISYSLFMAFMIFSVKKKPCGIGEVKNSYITCDLSLNFLFFVLIILVFFILGASRPVIEHSDDYRYLMLYEHVLNTGQIPHYLQSTEPGYTFLNIFFAYLDIPPFLFFGFLTAFTWSIFLVSFGKYHFLLPWILFFVMCNEYFFWSFNGIRQSVAMMFFLLSLKFVIERNKVKYVLALCAGALFHQSVLLTFPVYFLRRWRFNRDVWLALYILSLLFLLFDNQYFSTYFLQHVQDAIVSVSNYIPPLERYSRYVGSGLFISQAEEHTNSGLGIVLEVLTALYIIIYSRQVLSRFPELHIYYILFSIAAILANVFFSIEAIQRFMNYFIIISGFLLALTTYTSHSNLNKLVSIGVFFAYFLLFMFSIIKLY